MPNDGLAKGRDAEEVWSRCDSCGYPFGDLRITRCPECGWSGGLLTGTAVEPWGWRVGVSVLSLAICIAFLAMRWPLETPGQNIELRMLDVVPMIITTPPSVDSIGVLLAIGVMVLAVPLIVVAEAFAHPRVAETTLVVQACASLLYIVVAIQPWSFATGFPGLVTLGASAAVAGLVTGSAKLIIRRVGAVRRRAATVAC